MLPRILAFSGSLRRESFNKKLAAIAVSGARKAGAEVPLINLEDLSEAEVRAIHNRYSQLAEQALRTHQLLASSSIEQAEECPPETPDTSTRR